MREWLTKTEPGWFAGIVLTTLGIYVCLVAMTRIMGLRSFSKMSGFDFAVTVAIGSVLGSVVLSPNPPLVRGAVAMAVLFGLQWGVAALRARWSGLARVTDNRPILLMDGPTILDENLRRSNVTLADLKGKLREANVLRLEQVRAVVFESTGDVSVLHSDDSHAVIDEELLDGVERTP